VKLPGWLLGCFVGWVSCDAPAVVLLVWDHPGGSVREVAVGEVLFTLYAQFKGTITWESNKHPIMRWDHFALKFPIESLESSFSGQIMAFWWLYCSVLVCCGGGPR